MSLLKEIISTAGSAARILRFTEKDRRFPLLFAYLRIQFKYMLLFQVLRQRMTSEHFLGFDMHFANYEQFAIVFGEIFVPHVYGFRPTRPDPLIFDCGANIGMSVLYFKWMFPKARIVAFEPDPPTFELLKRNVEGNHLSDVDLHCEAVGGEAGSVPFHYMEGYAGWLMQSTVMVASPESKTRMVPMVTLSPLIHEQVDLLKVDTEGSEAEILTELETSGKLCSISRMVIEYHHHMKPGDDNLSRFLGVLESNGFGYMISSIFRTPFTTGEFAGLMVGAYRKESGETPPNF